MRYIDISEDVELHILQKHNVTAEEVFEVFFNPDLTPLIKRSPRGGGRYLALGQTLKADRSALSSQAGRYLTIAFERKSMRKASCET